MNKKLLIYDYLKNNSDKAIINLFFRKFSDNNYDELIINLDEIDDTYFIDFVYDIIFSRISEKKIFANTIEYDDIDIQLSENEYNAIMYTKMI